MLYEQRGRVPVGSRTWGPQLAILALHCEKRSKWEKLKNKMLFGGIYFDDLFMVLKLTVEKEDVISEITELLKDIT